jgi:hypothetical protein
LDERTRQHRSEFCAFAFQLNGTIMECVRVGRSTAPSAISVDRMSCRAILAPLSHRRRGAVPPILAKPNPDRLESFFHDRSRRNIFSPLHCTTGQNWRA